MNYQVIPPNQKLQNYISHFWVASWDNTVQKPNTTHYSIASSLTEITFAFESSNQNAELLFSVIQGHTHLPAQYHVTGFYHLIGVAFYSYAIPLLFNIPSSDLNQEFISLNTFLGSEGDYLNDQLATAESTAKRIQILSNYFENRINHQKLKDPLIANAISEIKKQNGAIKIELLADQHHLSHKQFNRRFKEFSGFNPKLYSRILRFESMLKSFPGHKTLTEVAYENGYFDQSHFIHDFKSFTGFSPQDFWKLNQ
ncbi:AraC family transcriptional regulator [bacterium SCSIO 12643]|nr:AraC family transcriptional regulator [bacterium SCSIO 12643]